MKIIKIELHEVYDTAAAKEPVLYYGIGLYLGTHYDRNNKRKLSGMQSNYGVFIPYVLKGDEMSLEFYSFNRTAEFYDASNQTKAAYSENY